MFYNIKNIKNPNQEPLCEVKSFTKKMRSGKNLKGEPLVLKHFLSILKKQKKPK